MLDASSRGTGTNIWIISFGFLGIQFGWGLQMANMSAIYQMLGAQAHEIALLWIAAPLTGLIVQPLVGHCSDLTWNRFGRRKPYFLVGAVIASAALVVMPHSSSLWMAAGLLWILDGAINTTMQPFRSFVADLLPNSQRARGFAAQTILIGVGAVISSALPWMLHDWLKIDEEANAEQSIIPPSIEYAFYLGAAVLLFCVVVTTMGTKENPPEDMEAFRARQRERMHPRHILEDLFYASKNMPVRMKELAWVQIFSWCSMFCIWTYFTPAIAFSVFGAQDAHDPAYHDAAAWTGVCFAVYNCVSLVAAFVMYKMVERVPPKTIHSVSLVCGALGFGGASLAQSQEMLLVAMLGIGVVWASMLSMPYAMLSDAVKKESMGVYMGLFNVFIVLPQIVVAIASGPLLSILPGEDARWMLGMAMVCMAISVVANQRVGSHSNQSSVTAA